MDSIQKKQTNFKHENQLLKEKQLIQLFPVAPYQIQIDIANLITDKLNQNRQKLIVIQSPTGTGKSYSLLVPIMNWLNQNRFSFSQNTNNNTQISATQKSVVPAWLIKSKSTPKISLQKQHNLKLNQLVSIDQAKNNNLARRKLSKSQQQKKKQVNFEQLQIDNQEILDKNQSKKNISTFNAKLFEQQMIVQKKQVPVKLIFVSRTHSQLQQIMESIQKIILENEKEKKSENLKNKQFEIKKLLSLQLGSKQQLCVNPDIKANNSKTGNNITQKCQYLLTHSHCPYFHQEKISQFMNKNLSQAKPLSQKNGLCGYYSLRNIQEFCDILCVPYATMLNESIRNKIGININNSIIVFDEGHNLLQYTKNSHSSQIVYEDLSMLSQRIQEYLQKYKEQMKQKNYNLIIHFNTILRALMTFMKKYHEQIRNQKFNDSQQNKNNNLNFQKNYLKMSTLEALIQIGLNEIRIHKIRQYVNLSNFDKKLAFFKTENKSNQDTLKIQSQQKKIGSRLNQNHIKLQTSYQNQGFSVSKIQNVIFWIENLVIQDQDTKVVLIKCGETKQNFFSLKDMSLKILCLQSNELQNIVQKSKMTIIAGGTMQPLDDFQSIFQKFKHGIYKFDHIITQSQCKIFISKRFQGKQIKFNHQNIANDMEFLIKVIKTTINKIINKNLHLKTKGQFQKQKQGIVVFIQNYRLIETLKKFLKNQTFFNLIIFDQSPKIKQEIETKQSQDNCFVAYKKKLQSQNIAILISVMGGKLSQGINFSDHLARKLIVFGLPYANIKSPEIIETMTYYDSLKMQNYSGGVYYQNMCIKSLNQTIGRAIRHKDDYADIYLIDSRFENIKQKLSTWMRKRIVIKNNLEQI